MNRSPPGFSVHGVLQARALGWTTTPSSRGSSWPRDRTLVSCIACRLFTIWPIGKSLFSLYSPDNCSIYWASFYVLFFCLFIRPSTLFHLTACLSCFYIRTQINPTACMSRLSSGVPSYVKPSPPSSPEAGFRADSTPHTTPQQYRPMVASTKSSIPLDFTLHCPSLGWASHWGQGYMLSSKE